MLRLFALSGSLRSHSSNTLLIERVAEIADKNIAIDVFTDLHRLPHFNPDNEPSNDVFVQDLTQRMRAADGLMVSTPEYAHGVPGSLKNALDWLVGSDAVIEKPFAILRACDRSIHAVDSLIEILKTMSGVHLSQADVTIDLRGKGEQTMEILTSNHSTEKIRDALAVFERFIRERC